MPILESKTIQKYQKYSVENGAIKSLIRLVRKYAKENKILRQEDRRKSELITRLISKYIDNV